ncbi:MAG: hypothetical protein R3336_03520, partial [Phycisphaeraceae bacterium]|nr:hypothetical protein [Phycisphaeraceae bacterium]
LSLIGLPPMVGFLGKVYLFGSAIEAGWTGLVIVAVINSAISAVYYLRIVGAAFFGEPAVAVTTSPSISRRIGAGVAAAAAIALGLAGGPLATAAHQATQVNASPVRVQTPATPEAEPTAEAEADARLDNKSLIKPLG